MADVEAGSFGTGRGALLVSGRSGPIGAALDGEVFTSDGYVVAAPCPAVAAGEQCRGAIDNPTASTHATVRGRVEMEVAPGLTFDLRSTFFSENQNGGTQYTTAIERRFEYAGGAHWSSGAGNLDLTVFGHRGRFEQDRTRATAVGTDPRGSEALSGHQAVPADDAGASALWRFAPLALAGTHTVTAGADARWITGTTFEQLFPAAVAPTSTVERDARGEQRLFGAFVEDLYQVAPAFGASLALRYDRWKNLDASRVEQASSGTSTTTAFPDRSGEELSPKLGLRAHVAPWASLRAAAYSAFRAPTLDELYRPFQVGNVRTDANENLTPERMRGGEVGLDLGRARGPSLRVTGFWNELQDPIVNVTTGTNARQRQNLGAARVLGLEADARWSFARHWSADAAYTLAPTRVTDAPGQPQLLDKQLPQSPEHRATLSVSFDDPGGIAANAQLHYLGRQYEDDVNTQPLAAVLLMDVFAAWHASRQLDLYVGVENVFNSTYLVGRSGLDTIGQPRSAHCGFRIRNGG